MHSGDLGSSGGSGEVRVGSDLPSEERQRVEQLIGKYSHLFANSGSAMSWTNLMEHEIDTGTSRPVHQNPYRSSAFELSTINEQFAGMLHDEAIRKSSSSWSLPVILVRKRDGSWRFFVGFR